MRDASDLVSVILRRTELNKTKPKVIPEELDEEMTWLQQVLAKRRAMLDAQNQALAPRQPTYQSPRWLIRPREDSYAGLTGEWHLGGGGYW